MTTKNYDNISLDRRSYCSNILNTVATHFEQQKKFGSDGTAGAACYNLVTRKDGSTVSCAVGCLMSEEMREINPKGTIFGFAPASIAALHDRQWTGALYVDLHLDTRVAFTDMMSGLQGLHDSIYGSLFDPRAEEAAVGVLVHALKWLQWMVDTGHSLQYIDMMARSGFNTSMAEYIVKIAEAIRNYSLLR